MAVIWLKEVLSIMKAFVTKIEYVLPKNKVYNPQNRLTKKVAFTAGIFVRMMKSHLI